MKYPCVVAVCVVVLAGCGRESGNDAAPPGSSGADGAVSQVPCSVTVMLLDFRFEPKALGVDSGAVELCTENAGESEHDIAVRDASGDDVGRTETLGPGETAHLSLDLAAGEYGIYCAEAGHESLGMRGTLTVGK